MPRKLILLLPQNVSLMAIELGIDDLGQESKPTEEPYLLRLDDGETVELTLREDGFYELSSCRWAV